MDKGTWGEDRVVIEGVSIFVVWEGRILRPRFEIEEEETVGEEREDENGSFVAVERA